MVSWSLWLFWAPISLCIVESALAMASPISSCPQNPSETETGIEIEILPPRSHNLRLAVSAIDASSSAAATTASTSCNSHNNHNFYCDVFINHRGSDGKGDLVERFLRRVQMPPFRRSPGTHVFTAPECCLGLTYHGKIVDVWALGVTLYCMVLGSYPFIGDSLQGTYDKIVHDPLVLPEDMNPALANLLEGLLCKDPKKRTSLEAVVRHPWVMKDFTSIVQVLGKCE